ncbi:MAG: thiamine phosphate synthase [Acidaminococcus sp.]|jgi:thiamine-phosphate pyrophosphorylase|uniref:thiamine phosphate synthase n=1 Tax=Acidaminococcus TaxID=904 RepID=UPI002664F703|nr:thiamine phosphate synthase [Acidaminococcus sp.]MDO5597664.1 thiamine phosphate synthase [Acidaminococcus sp.]
MKKFDLSVYLVTDRHCLRGRDFYAAIEEALKAGVTLLQLREKDASFQELLEEGRKVQALCRKYQVPFLIDDQVEVARALDADGVHLGQEDEAIERARAVLDREKIIGISAHNVEEALEAQRKGADYLGVGALYPTGSKKDASVLAPGVFRQVVEAVRIPVVGIGGIHEAQYGQVLDQGAAGCAMISGILGADDITATVKRLKVQAAEHLQKR